MSLRSIENWLLILKMFIFPLLLHPGLSHPAKLLVKGWVMVRKCNPDHVQHWWKDFHRWYWKVHLLQHSMIFVKMFGWPFGLIEVSFHMFRFHHVLVQCNTGNEPRPRIPFGQMLLCFHKVGKEVRQSSVRYTFCTLECIWKFLRNHFGGLLRKGQRRCCHGSSRLALIT